MKILKLFVIAFFASVLVTSLVLTPAVSSQTEAPASFDNLTNGFTSQAQFDADRAAFEEREEIADGSAPFTTHRRALSVIRTASAAASAKSLRCAPVTAGPMDRSSTRRAARSLIRAASTQRFRSAYPAGQ